MLTREERDARWVPWDQELSHLHALLAGAGCELTTIGEWHDDASVPTIAIMFNGLDDLSQLARIVQKGIE